MSLKIVPATEPIPTENIVLTIYAAPGLGKTSLAFTAAHPLLLDADKGSHRACNIKDRVIINTWGDAVGLTAEDIEPFSTVVVDTAGTLISKLMAQLIRNDPKNAGPYGGMSGKGWGNVNSAIEVLIQNIIGAKKDLVIVCHMDEQDKNGEITERIDASGKPRNMIYRVSDAMCRIRQNPDGSRYLDFDPREGGYGKNPAQLPKVPFSHPDKAPDTLAKVIQTIKDELNHQTEAQADALKFQKNWEKCIAEAADLPTINQLLDLAKEKKISQQQKALLIARATELTFSFDKTTGMFVAAKET
jgi:hypothetical protein